MQINADFFAERPDKKSSSTFPRFGKPQSGGGLCPKEFSMSTGIPFDHKGLTSNLFFIKTIFSLHSCSDEDLTYILNPKTRTLVCILHQFCEEYEK